jgi:hypothetical protein
VGERVHSVRVFPSRGWSCVDGRLSCALVYTSRESVGCSDRCGVHTTPFGLWCVVVYYAFLYVWVE